MAKILCDSDKVRGLKTLFYRRFVIGNLPILGSNFPSLKNQVLSTHISSLCIVNPFYYDKKPPFSILPPQSAVCFSVDLIYFFGIFSSKTTFVVEILHQNSIPNSEVFMELVYLLTSQILSLYHSQKGVYVISPKIAKLRKFCFCKGYIFLSF